MITRMITFCGGFVPKHGPNDGLLVPEHGQLSHENDQERLLLTSWGLQRSLAPRRMPVVHFATRADNSPIVSDNICSEIWISKGVVVDIQNQLINNNFIFSINFL